MESKEQTNNLGPSVVGIIKVEQQKENTILQSEDRLRNLWNIKHTNIHILGIPEGKEWDKGAEHVCEEIIAKMFPDLGKETGM